MPQATALSTTPSPSLALFKTEGENQQLPDMFALGGRVERSLAELLAEWRRLDDLFQGPVPHHTDEDNRRLNALCAEQIAVEKVISRTVATNLADLRGQLVLLGDFAENFEWEQSGLHRDLLDTIIAGVAGMEAEAAVT